jgi:hypothetical protein
MEANGLVKAMQSTDQLNHNKATALVRVHNDIGRAVNDGKCVLLILFDLSAAFDMIDHTNFVADTRFLGYQELP